MSDNKTQVFVLPLSSKGEPRPAGKGDYISLPIPFQPYILRFVVLSTSLMTNQGSIWCNCPPEGSAFDRKKFYEYPIESKFNKDCFIDIQINQPGTFCFYATYWPLEKEYFEQDETKIRVRRGSAGNRANSQSETNLFRETYMNASVKSNLTSSRKYYFTVNCGFKLNDKPLPLNSLQIESVISKWMGPVDTWDKKLAAIKNKGYNMVHFTPLQSRGSSNSPYSIHDQLCWDPVCFPNGEDDVKKLVKDMETKHQLLSLTDIVFNHTSHDSDWLREHPEVGYSVKNSPHLIPAIELEEKLTEFSGQLEELGLPTEIKNQDDLNIIIDSLDSYVLQEMRLWEYYVVDVETTMNKVKAIVKDPSRYDRILPTRVPEQVRDNHRELADYVIDESGSNFDLFGHARFLRVIDAEYFVSLLKTLVSNPEQVISKGLKILNDINEPLYEEYDDDQAAIIDNLRGRTNFTRLEPNGPKLGKISSSCPIQEPSFTKTTCKSTGEEISLANNGFIWNADPMTDFASSKSRAYLRRDVIPWGDCVKLKYGSKPSDCPYLWERMAKYTEMLAKHFHGFRIDNCHSTPIHVGEYFLDKARVIRPNLYVAAELFTGSEQKDRIFVERLGITSLIREAMQAWSTEELSRLVHKHGGLPIGSFSKTPLLKRVLPGENEDNIHMVRSTPIHALFMDCTHDNETPTEKRTMEDALSTGALVAMCACAVGSTVGYDECYPHALSVVNENRRYNFEGGFGDVKKELYKVHEQMGLDNAEEMYVHHEGQYITVHRVDAKQGTGWFLIARTKFRQEHDQQRMYY